MTIDANAQAATRSANEAKGLHVGERVPHFSAKDVHGKTYTLESALKNGPVVIVFIRGQWCPICNRHLSQLQDSLSLIYGKGASVVAISPEKSEFIAQTIAKTGAEFTVLYDEGYKISDAFDLTFTPDSITRFKYNTILGAKLKESHSDGSERLPIPATYIVDRSGTIVWRQFDPNYKNRSHIRDIVDNIPSK